MPKYHGKTGVVYMSTTGSTVATVRCNLSAWSLDQSTDYSEVTSFCDTNKTYVQGMADRSGTLTGFFDDTDATLFAGSESADGVKLYLYPSANAPARFFSGPAWINASITVSNTDAVKISATFKANGSWSRA